MEDLLNYEYVVSQKLKGVKVLRKIGLILLYILFVVMWFVFGFVTKMFPLLALCPVTLWMAVFFTWRYVQVDFKYTVSSGSVTFSKIYGHRSKKNMGEIRLKDCVTIAPLNEQYRYLIGEFGPERIINFLSYDGAENAYFLLTEKNGEKIVAYLEATEKFLKICRYYNSAATTVITPVT